MKTKEHVLLKIRRAPSAGKFAGAAIATAFLLLGLLSPAAAVQNATPSLKALIVTGQNASHDWRVSTAAMKQMLEDTGLFQVDVAESPAPGAKMDGFEPRFQAYRLVVLNYYGDIWPQSTRRSFAAYVKNGGGVVVYHASSIAFPGWPEYNEIIGLGGWSSRNESFGPYVIWKDGKIVRDPEPGVAGYHPQPFTYLVVNRDASHPITAGLPERWMHAEDELYSMLRGPANNLTVLATALSDLDHGGTGRDEPVLFTVNYGAGRVFHTVLGHAGGAQPPALECAGFIVTFQRGAEWAATGKVTQKVPDDFPATNRTVSAPEDVRLWPGYRPPSLEAVLKDLSSFEYSRDEAVLYRLRDYVLAHNKSAEARAACEQELLGDLESASHPHAILAVCRALRLIGSEKSVPVLERMLQREDTTDMARYALEKIPAAEADAALLRALNATQDKVKIGIISSLGQRKTAEAIKPLAALVFDQDGALAQAAATSLGRIGGGEAAAALTEAYGKADGERRADLAYAILGSVEEDLAAGNFQTAQALCDQLLAVPPEGLPLSVRRTALKDKILCLEKSEAARLVLDILTRGPQDLQEPAIGQVTKLFSAAELPPLCAMLPKLPEPSGVQLLAVLAGYPRDAVQPTVLLAAKSDILSVRVAAIGALARVGDPTTVEFLAGRAAAAKGGEQAAARSSLSRIPGKDVDEAVLFKLLAAPKEDVKSELIQAIAGRRILAGKGLLMSHARAGSARISAESARALRVIASPFDIPNLVEILLETGDETAQDEMRSTIGAVAQKISDPDSRASAVKHLLVPETGSEKEPLTDVRKRCLLYRTLGNIGDDSSLALLRAALKAGNPDIEDAAVRALAEWPKATPREDCLAIARTSTNLTHQVLALRGYVRMVSLEKYQSPQTAVQSLKTALDMATRPDEIKLVLGALEDFASPEALALAESLLTTEGVQAEAQAAVDKIKGKLEKETHP
jgi:type 1 glutamine amidotransferase/HEAT repeat protein